MIRFVVTACGFRVVVTLTPTSPYALFAGRLLIAGSSSRLVSSAVHTTVLGAVPADRLGMGPALNGRNQQLSIAHGVAVASSGVTVRYRIFAPPILNDETGLSLGRSLCQLSSGVEDLIGAAQRRSRKHRASAIGISTCLVFVFAGAAVAWRVKAPLRR